MTLRLAAAAPTQTTNSLAFDAAYKDTNAVPGLLKYCFAFWATNVSANPVVITQILSSCGCVVAGYPTLPWQLDPGESGHIDAQVDITNRELVSIQTLTVLSTAGNRVLMLRVNIPPQAQVISPEQIRLRNRQFAATVPRAVFRNDCARCHLDPAFGKSGRELYAAVCANCHEAEPRAPSVPDLRTVNPVNDPERWRGFIKYGKSRTLMPAFAQSEGGPLTDAQVDSLVAYLTTELRKEIPGALRPKVFCGVPFQTRTDAAANPANQPSISPATNPPPAFPSGSRR